MEQPRTVTQHLLGSSLLVLVGPDLDRSALQELALPEATELYDMVEAVPRPREHDTVLLAVRDVLGLRRAATGLGHFGSSRQVGVWFEREPATLPGVVSRPEWPVLEEVAASRSQGRFLLLTFVDPAPVRSVLLHLARSSSPAAALSSSWPVLGARRDQPWLWPPADPAATIAVPERLFDDTVDFPPDLVVVEDADDQSHCIGEREHPVLGRSPVVSRVEPDLSWGDLAVLSGSEARDALERRGRLSLGPVDEKVINPIGFDRDPVGTAVPLSAGPGHALGVRLEADDLRTITDGHGSLSDTDLPLLRSLPGVELGWQGTNGPQTYCRAVAGLAASGVPLVTGEVPGWAELLLDPGLVAALRGPVDLTDALSREEHSIRLRRAALTGHASGPWRRALAQSFDQQYAPSPRVSVLLVTRRPEMLPFALHQVSRQRAVDLEVVLATHGFEPDPEVLRSFTETADVPLLVVETRSSELFGTVLNRAVERASGDVLLKMDDDDWYGPDFAADLLLARGYSGAEIVGCPPEFTFLEPLWLTTRRLDPTETFRPFVAGGTMLIDRGALRSVGGFRNTRKYVDAGLLSGVLNAGGSVYRTHGLGYVLRRGRQGHTWDPGLGYFITSKRAAAQWRGFRPSALLEPSPEDVPLKADDEKVFP